MCGISGIIRFDRPGSESEKSVLQMQATIQHRGRDNKGIYIGSFSSLSANLLSIIDIEKDRQPMTSKGGRYTIVYNGEVYNFRELKEELKHQWDFQTNCDTEVVLAAYTVWKEKCLTRLNGMFSFFIWDEKEKTGFGARDLLGIKPFAYSYEDGIFIFASEAKAILTAKNKPPKADEAAILEYLVAPLFSGVETSMFEGVEYLQPGHFFTLSSKGLQINRWGSYDLTGTLEMDIESVVEAFNTAIQNAVKRHLIADVPVGAYLSGGLDSSLICYHASKTENGLSKVFTIEFEDHDKFDYSQSIAVTSDDTPFAKNLASHIDINTPDPHDIVRAKRKNLLRDIKNIAKINDALPAWEMEIALHNLAMGASRSSHKAVLVGDVADETHYGYHFLLDEEAIREPAGMISRFSIPVVRKKFFSYPIGFFNKKYKNMVAAEGHRWDSLLGQKLATTCLIIKRWLPRLLHNADIHSMAYSVETRVPFADTEVLNLAKTIHPDLAFHNNIEKWHIRRAVKDLIPEKNRKRKKSSLPMDFHASATYQKAATAALSQNGDFLRKYLEIDTVNQLCDPSNGLNEKERSLLFRITVLDCWSRHYNVKA